ncbi:MAG: LysR family transcriptional regulator [Xanthomonadales bacterium]|nr:LysR family transcriptional regulator [Xanthomonadales bacterium]
MGQLEEMRVYVRIVEAGGIGKAADQLGMAKSGISRSLASLENRLGVQLINRTTRRTSLTGVGREYYEAAVKLIGDVSELDALTANAETSLQGHLRLAVPLSFGLCHLSAAIDAFVSEHPGLTIHIDFSDRLVDLVEQGVDLAIRITDLKDSSLKARRICPVRLRLCASPAYLKAHGTPLRLDDLKNHNILSYDIGAGAALRMMDGQGNEQLVQASSRIMANNGDFLRDMAVAGHGIVLLPTFIAWQSLANGELLSVLEPHVPTHLNAWAVYPQTRYLSQRARLFIDFLAERFGDNPYWDSDQQPR